MIPFKTTPDQVLKLATIMIEMKSSGLKTSFIADVSEIGIWDQGVFELMELWSETTEDAAEQARILVDLQRSLNDIRAIGAPNGPVSNSVMIEGVNYPLDRCWHCHDAILVEDPPRCESCPGFYDCDLENCPSPGCVAR